MCLMTVANLVGDREGRRGGAEHDGGDTAHGGGAGKVDAEALIGSLIDGRYFLEDQLGEGGAATTFGARDRTTGERCALKLFRTPGPRSEMHAAEEFRRLTGVAHPGVVRVRDLGRTDEVGSALFLVTDEVRG